MRDKLIMNQKERDRKVVLELVRNGHMTLRDISKRLHISYRQTKRIWKRYKDEKDIGLIHRLRGKPSKRAFTCHRRNKFHT